MVYVDVPGIGLMTVRADGDATEGVGDQVALSPVGDRIYRFDEGGKTMA